MCVSEYIYIYIYIYIFFFFFFAPETFQATARHALGHSLKKRPPTFSTCVASFSTTRIKQRPWCNDRICSQMSVPSVQRHGHSSEQAFRDQATVGQCSVNNCAVPKLPSPISKSQPVRIAASVLQAPPTSPKARSDPRRQTKQDHLAAFLIHRLA